MNTAQVNKKSGNAVFDTVTINERLNLGGPIIPKNGLSAITINGGLRVFGDNIVTGSNVPTGPSGGDLGGVFPNPTVNGINGTPITDNAPLDSYVLTFGPSTLVTFDGTISTTTLPADTLVLDSTPVVVDGSFALGMTLAHGAISGTVVVISLNAGVLGVTGSSYTITSSGTVDNSYSTLSGNIKVWNPAPPGGGAPTGPAGGDLSGSYPNPNLLPQGGVMPGSYGDADNSVTINVNNKGIITNVSETPLNAIAPTDTIPGGLDLEGTYGVPIVGRLRGTLISAVAPTLTGQVLTYDAGASSWKPAAASVGTFPPVMSVDLSGAYDTSLDLVPTGVGAGAKGVTSYGTGGVFTYPQITVNAGGRIISSDDVTPFGAAVPTAGYVPIWQTLSGWVPGPAPGGSPSGSAGGDLFGTYPMPTVVGLRGITVSSTLPTITGQLLKYNGSQWAPSVGADPIGSAGGDLSGTYPNPTVDGLRGVSINAAAAMPNDGQMLFYNGSSWTPGSLIPRLPANISGTTFNRTTNEDTSVVFATAATCTVTLGAASAYPGVVLHLKNINTQIIQSASNNVVPYAGGPAMSDIFLAVAGPKFATLQSNGSDWVIMASD